MDWPADKSAGQRLVAPWLDGPDRTLNHRERPATRSATPWVRSSRRSATWPEAVASAQKVVLATLTVMSRLDRITSDTSICHGQPTIRGLRYPVENLLELLASGMTIGEIIEDHPDLERDDLLAALEFAALTTGIRRVVPLGVA